MLIRRKIQSPFIDFASIVSANIKARIDSIFKRNAYPIFKNSQQRIRLPVFPLPIGSVFQRQTTYEQPLVFPFRLLHITLNFAFDKDK
ncbi:hypothetical protein T01_10432, partial [Trichinella spiralis]